MPTRHEPAMRRHAAPRSPPSYLFNTSIPAPAPPVRSRTPLWNRHNHSRRPNRLRAGDDPTMYTLALIYIRRFADSFIIQKNSNKTV